MALFSLLMEIKHITLRKLFSCSIFFDVLFWVGYRGCRNGRVQNFSRTSGVGRCLRCYVDRPGTAYVRDDVTLADAARYHLRVDQFPAERVIERCMWARWRGPGSGRYRTSRRRSTPRNQSLTDAGTPAISVYRNALRICSGLEVTANTGVTALLWPYYRYHSSS